MWFSTVADSQLECALPNHSTGYVNAFAEILYGKALVEGVGYDDIACTHGLGWFGNWCHVAACEWASTNHSHLSIPRATSVNRSAVAASLSSSASPMVVRAS